MLRPYAENATKRNPVAFLRPAYPSLSYIAEARATCCAGRYSPTVAADRSKMATLDHLAPGSDDGRCWRDERSVNTRTDADARRHPANTGCQIGHTSISGAEEVRSPEKCRQHHLRRWPAAILDRRCARRRRVIRPGRRNGPFQPNRETSVEDQERSLLPTQNSKEAVYVQRDR